MKKQVNVRVSEATREKLDFLTSRYGTQTEVVAVAIDRLYADYLRRGESVNCAACGHPSRDGLSSDHRWSEKYDSGKRPPFPSRPTPPPPPLTFVPRLVVMD